MKQLHLGTSTPLEPFASHPFSGTGYKLPSGPLRAKGYEVYRLTRGKQPEETHRSLLGYVGTRGPWLLTARSLLSGSPRPACWLHYFSIFPRRVKKRDSNRFPAGKWTVIFWITNELQSVLPTVTNHLAEAAVCQGPVPATLDPSYL